MTEGARLSRLLLPLAYAVILLALTQEGSEVSRLVSRAVYARAKRSRRTSLRFTFNAAVVSRLPPLSLVFRGIGASS